MLTPEPSQLSLESLLLLQAAVEVARQKGEHYPVCNMPPREVMNADRATQRAWREAHRGECTCWKAEMERKLR